MKIHGLTKNAWSLRSDGQAVRVEVVPQWVLYCAYSVFVSRMQPMWKIYFRKAQKTVTKLQSLSAISITTLTDHRWMPKPPNYTVKAQEWVTSIKKNKQIWCTNKLSNNLKNHRLVWFYKCIFRFVPISIISIDHKWLGWNIPKWTNCLSYSWCSPRIGCAT